MVLLSRRTTFVPNLGRGCCMPVKMATKVCGQSGMPPGGLKAIKVGKIVDLPNDPEELRKHFILLGTAWLFVANRHTHRNYLTWLFVANRHTHRDYLKEFPPSILLGDFVYSLAAKGMNGQVYLRPFWHLVLSCEQAISKR